MQFSGNLKSPLLKNATVECLSFIIYVCMIYVLVKYWFYFYFSAKEVLLILIINFSNGKQEQPTKEKVRGYWGKKAGYVGCTIS